MEFNLQIINVKSDLPIQSGSNEPARDSEYLLPGMERKDNTHVRHLFLIMISHLKRQWQDVAVWKVKLMQARLFLGGIAVKGEEQEQLYA